MHIFAHRLRHWFCHAVEPVNTGHLHTGLLRQLLSSTAVWNVHHQRLDMLGDRSFGQNWLYLRFALRSFQRQFVMRHEERYSIKTYP